MSISASETVRQTNVRQRFKKTNILNSGGASFNDSGSGKVCLLDGAKRLASDYSALRDYITDNTPSTQNIQTLYLKQTTHFDDVGSRNREFRSRVVVSFRSVSPAVIEAGPTTKPRAN